MSTASSGPLTRRCPRSPWYQPRTTTIGRPTAKTIVAICLTVAGHAKESLTKPSTCSSTHAPAAYASAHWATLRRRSLAQILLSSRSAGVSVNRRPPWRRSVAASDPVAGVNGARGGLRLSSPRSAGCQHRLFGQGLEASAITASARRNPAAAVAGSERESTSWESGNLGSCRAFADSPGCQDSRFSVPRPGGDLGGRDRRAGEARAGAGGNLANWKPGTLGSARRGVGRVDAGPPLPGVPAWGALGRRPWPPPWPGGARPPRARGTRLRREPAPVLAKASTV